MTEKNNELINEFKEIYDNLEKANLLSIRNDSSSGYDKLKVFSQHLDGIEMLISKKEIKYFRELSSINFLFKTARENLFSIQIDNEPSMITLNMNVNGNNKKYDANQTTQDEKFYEPLLTAVNIQKRFELINQQALSIIKEQALQEEEKKNSAQKEKDLLINDSINKIKQMRGFLGSEVNNTIKNKNN